MAVRIHVPCPSLLMMAESLSHREIGETLGLGQSTVSKCIKAGEATQIIETAARLWLASNGIERVFIVRTQDGEMFTALMKRINMQYKEL